MTDTEWLLGKLAIVASAWKIIALGTVALACSALLALFLFAKPIYTARMVVPLSPYVSALISGGIIGQGLTVSNELAPKSGLHAVSASNTNPETARVDLQRAFDQFIAASKPSPSLRVRILSDIDTSSRALSDLRGMGETMPRSTTMREEIQNLELRISKLQLMLDGFRPDEVPEPPGKVVQSWHPLSAKPIAFTFFGSLIIMLLFVFARDEIGHIRR